MVKMILWFRNMLVTLLDIRLCPPLKRIFGKVDGINIHFVLMVMLAELYLPTKKILGQGGRTWQPFVGSKKGNENFRQARINNFRAKCFVFARNRKFAKLTQ